MRVLDVDQAVTPDGVVAPARVVVAEGRIQTVGRPAAIGRPAEATVEELLGTLVPGFVDLQVNGIGGHQYGQGTDLLAATGPALLASGVTAHCPTITTRALTDYPAAVAGLGADAGPHAPRNLGIHLEGPFLSPLRAGAHDPAHLVAPRREDVEALVDRARPAIVTLAPELDPDGTIIRLLADRGIVVSAGHTDATYTQLRAAVDHGVTMVTHLFNAQRPLHHRDPGTAGGALLLDVHVGLILDGEHIHPDLAALVLRLTDGRAVAVTDAVATAGLPLGTYAFGEVTVDTSSGAPRLPDGTLAGSNLTMDAAFRFVAATLGLPAAVRATATTPARVLGRTELGTIAPGAAADLVLLDYDLGVAGVWRDGVRVAGQAV